ncbi:WD-40 repeat-containing protein [Rhizoctonia solani]|uniref:WD-40 repeat-containing protein n=1 Tax=Rhizoctonia solani TaxID=456999 RepID=A0A8H8T034_9AGAM|nr:WD-40 repeat-containing protein [Rhizoctonia solani]QRW24269.1 WD-40 repeat-containing protein [Rhizoctonia solani]
MTPAGSQVWCVVFPNGAYIAAGTHDKRVLIWDAVTCQMTIDPFGPYHAVRAIAISPDNTQAHNGKMRSVDYSPDGRWLASGSLTVLSAYGVHPTGE